VGSVHGVIAVMYIWDSNNYVYVILLCV